MTREELKAIIERWDPDRTMMLPELRNDMKALILDNIRLKNCWEAAGMATGESGTPEEVASAIQTVAVGSVYLIQKLKGEVETLTKERDAALLERATAQQESEKLRNMLNDSKRRLAEYRAERDSLKADLRQTQEWLEQEGKKLTEVRTERDSALADNARLRRVSEATDKLSQEVVAQAKEEGRIEGRRAVREAVKRAINEAVA